MQTDLRSTWMARLIMLPSFVFALFGAVSLLLTPTTCVAQETAELEFYYDFLAELNCDGLPLNSATITAGECVDISTVSALDKHWQAFSGVAVPTGCSGEFFCACSDPAWIKSATVVL